jgi:DNA-binding CsgD family transcriptional regulator
LGITLLDGLGHQIYANINASMLFRGHPRPQINGGRSLHDLYPTAWADERLGFLQQAMLQQNTMVVRSIWRGRRLECTFQLVGVEGKPNEPTSMRIMVVTKPGVAGAESLLSPTVHWSEVVELGRLDALSPRELEVLALLSQGISYEDIARHLKRSRKTVDNHRQSIGRKLEICDRITLARLASEAGLELRDARARRVRFVPHTAELGVIEGKPTQPTMVQESNGLLG